MTSIARGVPPPPRRDLQSSPAPTERDPLLGRRSASPRSPGAQTTIAPPQDEPRRDARSHQHGTNRASSPPRRVILNPRIFVDGSQRPDQLVATKISDIRDSSGALIHAKQYSLPKYEMAGTGAEPHTDAHMHDTNYVQMGVTPKQKLAMMNEIGIRNSTSMPIPTSLINVESPGKAPQIFVNLPQISQQIRQIKSSESLGRPQEKCNHHCDALEVYYVPQAIIAEVEKARQGTSRAHEKGLSLRDFVNDPTLIDRIVSKSVIYPDTSVNSHLAHAIKNSGLTQADRSRIDPMITGLHLGDQRVAHKFLKELFVHKGVFTGIGEITLNKELIDNLFAGHRGQASTRTDDEAGFNMAARTEALVSLMEMAGVVGAPVVLHCDIDSLRNQMVEAMSMSNRQKSAPREPANLAGMTQLLTDSRVKDTTVVWAHAGGLGRFIQAGEGHTDELEKLLKACPNLKLDISWTEVSKQLTQKDKVDNWVSFMQRYSDRICFGSDTLAPKNSAQWNENKATFDTLFEKLDKADEEKYHAKGISRGNILNHTYENTFVAARQKLRFFEEHVLTQDFHDAHLNNPNGQPVSAQTVRAALDAAHQAKDRENKTTTRSPIPLVQTPQPSPRPGSMAKPSQTPGSQRMILNPRIFLDGSLRPDQLVATRISTLRKSNGAFVHANQYSLPKYEMKGAGVSVEPHTDSHMHDTNYVQRGLLPKQKLAMMDEIGVRNSTSMPVSMSLLNLEIQDRAPKTFVNLPQLSQKVREMSNVGAFSQQGCDNDTGLLEFHYVPQQLVAEVEQAKQGTPWAHEKGLSLTDFAQDPTLIDRIVAQAVVYPDTSVNSHLAHAIHSAGLTDAERSRIDPMITGLHLGDDRAAHKLLKELYVNKGVFTGIGEVTLNKELGDNMYSDPRSLPSVRTDSEAGFDMESRVDPAIKLIEMAGVIGMPVVLRCDIDSLRNQLVGEIKSLNREKAAPRELANLAGLTQVLTDERAKNTTVVWAHAGGLGQFIQQSEGHTFELDKLLKACPNLKLDISWSEVGKQLTKKDNMDDWVAFMQKHSDRICFGSDSLAPQNSDQWLDAKTTLDSLFKELDLADQKQFGAKGISKGNILNHTYENTFVAARDKIRFLEDHVLTKDFHDEHLNNPKGQTVTAQTVRAALEAARTAVEQQRRPVLA